VAGAIKGMLD